MGGTIRIGVGGWTYEPWRGAFYPDGLAQKRELEYASRQLTSIEINGTFYGSQKPESFRKWRDETPDDFVFAVKGPRFTTNRRELATAGESIERFFATGVLELGDKLGPVNWQLAEHKKFDPDDFAAFLALLPAEVEGRPIRHAVEVRHASFRTPELVALARKHGVAIVLAADADYPQIADPTAPFVYLRIMGTQASETLWLFPRRPRPLGGPPPGARRRGAPERPRHGRRPGRRRHPPRRLPLRHQRPQAPQPGGGDGADRARRPSGVSRTARSRVRVMEAPMTEEPRTLEELNRAIAASEPIMEGGTRAVLGEGPVGAAIAFVGEQPGDQEDLAGRPFVGPAGRVLDRAMAEAGIERKDTYVTNAVKHFKYVQRGKRRLHQRPNAGEVKHYRWWLKQEIELVGPRVVVALGATAVLALAGKALPISRHRGPTTFDNRRGYITVHPSYLLRVPGPGRQAGRLRRLPRRPRPHPRARRP